MFAGAISTSPPAPLSPFPPPCVALARPFPHTTPALSRLPPHPAARQRAHAADDLQADASRLQPKGQHQLRAHRLEQAAHRAGLGRCPAKPHFCRSFCCFCPGAIRGTAPSDPAALCNVNSIVYRIWVVEDGCCLRCIHLQLQHPSSTTHILSPSPLCVRTDGDRALGNLIGAAATGERGHQARDSRARLAPRHHLRSGRLYFA